MNHSQKKWGHWDSKLGQIWCHVN